MKDIKGYEGLYAITEQGEVWGYKKKHWISQHKTAKGYMRISLCKNNKHNLFMVHRLVAETYIPVPSWAEEVNHKDFNRANNSVDNLEWITHADNVRYSKNKPVAQYDLYGNFLRFWDSTRQIERELNIDHRQISDCCNHKQSVCHGFIWKYKEAI